MTGDAKYTDEVQRRKYLTNGELRAEIAFAAGGDPTHKTEVREIEPVATDGGVEDGSDVERTKKSPLPNGAQAIGSTSDDSTTANAESSHEQPSKFTRKIFPSYIWTVEIFSQSSHFTIRLYRSCPVPMDTSSHRGRGGKRSSQLLTNFTGSLLEGDRR